MAKMYGIYHEYDVDGGFGDGITQSDLILTTADEEVAKAYVSKWSRPYCYDKPYDYLYRNELYYEELPECITEADLEKSPVELGAEMAFEGCEPIEVPNEEDES